MCWVRIDQGVGYELIESGYETSEPGYESSGYETSMGTKRPFFYIRAFRVAPLENKDTMNGVNWR